MSLRDAHPGEPGETGCSVWLMTRTLAEGTDGCGAGWSSPPKGRPLKTTNARKRRTAPNATAVRLTRSPQRFASSTVTDSCSAAWCCCLGRRGGTEGLTAPLRSRAALSTGRARRTTSPPRPRARTASCMQIVLLSRPPRRNRRLKGHRLSGSSRAVLSTPRSVRAVVSTPRSVRVVLSTPRSVRVVLSTPRSFAWCCQHRDQFAWCYQHRDQFAQCCQPAVRGESPHASAPAQLRAAKYRSAVSAAAAEPKAQRPPYPHPVVQCYQPVVRGEPPHASAPAQLRAVQHRSAVSAAAAEPKA